MQGRDGGMMITSDAHLNSEDLNELVRLFFPCLYMAGAQLFVELEPKWVAGLCRPSCEGQLV